MSTKSKEFVFDFQAPGYEPEMKNRKTPRTLDSCNLQLIPFHPHTFDSFVTLMMNHEKSPFSSCPYIMCAGCNDHKFWLWDPNLGLEEPKNCRMCPHCDAIICNRCAMCHSKFIVANGAKKVSFLQRIGYFPQEIQLMSPTTTNIYWLVPV